MSESVPPSEPAPSTAFASVPQREAAPSSQTVLSAEQLLAVLDVTLRVGMLTAGAGAAGFRVREAMRRTASCFGVTRLEVVYGLDALHATVFSGGLRQTEVVRIPALGVDMNRISRVDLLSRELAASPGSRTPQELAGELDAIEAAPLPYPVWITPWVLGGSCGAFCGVIGGSPWQIAAAFVGAFAGHCLRLYHARKHHLVATVVVSCAFVSALASWASVRALGLAGQALVPGLSAEALGPGKAVLASVLYLIPGVPLVQALTDVLHFDLTAGLARSAHATLVLVCIAVGVLTFLSLTGFALT
jgi:uncharacterized membrane protein YjjP (DUF1212 family)